MKKDLAALLGPGRYLDRPEELACYAYDAFLEEAMPEVVVLPESTEQVSQIMKIAASQKFRLRQGGRGPRSAGRRSRCTTALWSAFPKWTGSLKSTPRTAMPWCSPG